MRVYLVVLTTFAVVIPTSTIAQSPTDPEPSLVVPIAAGLGSGLVGFLAGGLIGLALDPNCENFDDGLCLPTGLWIGSAFGGTTGLVVGTHLGNRSRGRLGLVYLASAATWGAGIGLAVLTRDVAPLLVMPVVQTGITVWTERATGRKKERASGVRAQTYLAPNSRGVRVGMRMTY